MATVAADAQTDRGEMMKEITLLDIHPGRVAPSDTQIAISAPAIAKAILSLVEENPEREGLKETPQRMVRAWEEMFSGYEQSPEDIITMFDNTGDQYDEMVVLRDIEFFSTCEHHMLPFFGRAHVAYIPGNKVVGISKVARLVDMYSRRMQIQERLTGQIADALVDHAGAKGVGVILEAQHLCMVMRGVKKQNSVMTTSALRGVLKDKPEARAEFMSLITGGRR